MESLFFIQKQHKNRSPKQIKTNGGKELGIVTILSSDQKEINKNSNPPIKLRKLSEKILSQRHAAAAKHIKNHQVRNQEDLNINSNLADVFYVPTSTEENSINTNEQMQGDEPTGNVDDYRSERKISLMENSNQNDASSEKSKSKNQINSTVASIENRLPTKLNTVLTNIHRSNDKVALNIDVPIDMESKDSNMPYELVTPNHVSDDDKIESNQQNDELNSDDTNEGSINVIKVRNDVTAS